MAEVSTREDLEKFLEKCLAKLKEIGITPRVRVEDIETCAKHGMGENYPISGRILVAGDAVYVGVHEIYHKHTGEYVLSGAELARVNAIRDTIVGKWREKVASLAEAHLKKITERNAKLEKKLFKTKQDLAELAAMKPQLELFAAGYCVYGSDAYTDSAMVVKAATRSSLKEVPGSSFSAEQLSAAGLSGSLSPEERFLAHEFGDAFSNFGQGTGTHANIDDAGLQRIAAKFRDSAERLNAAGEYHFSEVPAHFIELWVKGTDMKDLKELEELLPERVYLSMGWGRSPEKAEEMCAVLLKPYRRLIESGMPVEKAMAKVVDPDAFRKLVDAYLEEKKAAAVKPARVR